MYWAAAALIEGLAMAAGRDGRGKPTLLTRGRKEGWVGVAPLVADQTSGYIHSYTERLSDLLPT